MPSPVLATTISATSSTSNCKGINATNGALRNLQVYTRKFICNEKVAFFTYERVKIFAMKESSQTGVSQILG